MVNVNTEPSKDFIMSPKIDFAFKLLFGDEKNKDLLISFLSAILDENKDEFENLEIMNTELPRQFKEDKKGVLDVRVRTKNGEQIDIEIQLSYEKSLPNRTLYYWSRMYTSQVKAGDPYKVLKKCIAINIVDFERIPVNKLHTVYYILEKETGHKLTDLLEIHFLALKKLADSNAKESIKPDKLLWLEFLNCNGRSEMEMLAKKNKDIKKAYDVLHRVSEDEKLQVTYLEREMALMDEATLRAEVAEAEEVREENKKVKKELKVAEEEVRIVKEELKVAKEVAKHEFTKGIEQGIEKTKKETALKLIQEGAETAFIVKITGLTEEEINDLRN